MVSQQNVARWLFNLFLGIACISWESHGVQQDTFSYCTSWYCKYFSSVWTVGAGCWPTLACGPRSSRCAALWDILLRLCSSRCLCSRGRGAMTQGHPGGLVSREGLNWIGIFHHFSPLVVAFPLILGCLKSRFVSVAGCVLSASYFLVSRWSSLKRFSKSKSGVASPNAYYAH